MRACVIKSINCIDLQVCYEMCWDSFSLPFGQAFEPACIYTIANVFRRAVRNELCAHVSANVWALYACASAH